MTEIINYINIFNKNIYNYLIINYLSIQKIIKKYNKKNYKNEIIYLDKYKFYNDIINPNILMTKYVIFVMKMVLY